jgi:chorismate mutase
MDVRSTSLSRRAALTGLGGVALLAAAACSPSKEAPSSLPAGQAPPVPTGDPSASLAEQRKVVDDLDKQIIELLKQRDEAAATLQKIQGGRDNSRDQAIISAYAAGAGANGASVGRAVIGLDNATTSTSATSTTATSTSH